MHNEDSNSRNGYLKLNRILQHKKIPALVGLDDGGSWFWSILASIRCFHSRVIRMKLFLSWKRVWCFYLCMSLSRSIIDNFFTPSFSKNSATATFVRDRKLSVYYKKTKWPYLSPRVSNVKNKTTLFPSTFKIEGNKVVLFFW